MGERERHSLGQTGRGRRFSQHKAHPNATEGMATGHHRVHPREDRVGSVGETNFPYRIGSQGNLAPVEHWTRHPIEPETRWGCADVRKTCAERCHCVKGGLESCTTQRKVRSMDACIVASNLAEGEQGDLCYEGAHDCRDDSRGGESGQLVCLPFQQPLLPNQGFFGIVKVKGDY